MPEPKESLDQALSKWDRDAVKPWVEEAQRQREEFIDRFPLAAWPSMSLETYALGTEKFRDSFSYWLEYKTAKLGSVRGGQARKHLLYIQNKSLGWYFDPTYSSIEEAWDAVRAGFVHGFELAQKGEFAAIDDIDAIRGGGAVRTKATFIYFPDQLLPICSSGHLEHFLTLLGAKPTIGVVALNRQLFELMHADSRFAGWTPYEMERFFYSWADPRETLTVVKIAPGEGAKFWDDCLRNGYICVGWDEVGDLRAYASPEEFRESFNTCYHDTYHGNKSQITNKANEVWTLMTLEPGDLVVANRGKSHVLAIGTVNEPGYEWRPERENHKHTVAVDWDTSFDKDIEPVERWGLTTVAKVPHTLYQKIISGPAPHPGPDELLTQIEAALTRRGQAILYGPPGTGKTRAARQFSVWWLQRGNGADATPALGSTEKLIQLENHLGTANVTGTGVGQLTRVTFHPSYTYEDFVEGYKPSPSSGEGLHLAMTDGIFTQVCDAAAADPERSYLLVIDEINRGNLPKIFGELITLLELDKRGLEVTLPQSGRKLCVPKNVYLVGTMNTADRSIRLLDAAIRRRFAFIELMPDLDILTGATVGPLELGQFLAHLNQEIAKTAGREKQIGHSYFLDPDGQPIVNVDEFARRFREELLPLLQEYAYDNFDELEGYLGNKLVKASEQRFDDTILADPDMLLQTLSDTYKSAAAAGA